MPATTPLVAIAGDAAIDWYEERITHYPEDETRKGLPWQNWRLRPGTDWYSLPGGVLLLSDMLHHAGGAKDKVAPLSGIALEIKAFPTLDPIPDGIPAGPPQALIHSLAVIQPDEEETKKSAKPKKDAPKPAKTDIHSYRAKQFLGYRGPTNSDGDAPTQCLYRDETGRASLDIAVLDDAGNGLRDTRENWPGWLRRLKSQPPRLIVLKLNEPLPTRGTNHLWDHLKGVKAPLLVIVNGYDLRREGIDLSWRLSWERTAYDIARATRRPSALSALTDFGDVIIRLGVEGAAVVRRGRPRQIHLLCDPARIEDGGEGIPPGHVTGLTSAFTAGIVCKLASTVQARRRPDGADLISASKAGLRCAYRLAYHGLKVDVAGSGRHKIFFPYKEIFSEPSDVGRTYQSFRVEVGQDIKALRPANNYDQTLAEDIVRYGHSKIEQVPHAYFGQLLTADFTEIEALRSITNLFRKYLDDVKIEKPLSVAVFGPPGSGKSFAIKEIAATLGVDRLKATEFNVAEWQGPEDLTDALHVARDIRLNGATPLVFFDEFDSELKGDPLAWLKSFLAPMQDGRFKEKSRQHEVGRAIFVFAGGTAETFSDFEKYSDSKAASRRTTTKNLKRTPASAKDARATKYSKEFQGLKGPDFISRLSGYVDIRGLNPTNRGSKSYMLRRAIILRTHLEKYKNLFDSGEKLNIDAAVLNAFLTVAKFNHGNRSLEAIVRMSSLSDETYHFARSVLPSDEQLKLHVDPKKFLPEK